MPLIIFFLTIILTVYFYHLLPDEVAYHFKSDGSPDKWLSRGAITLWAVVPQLLLTLLAGAASWGMAKLNVLFKQPDSPGVKSESIMLLMGNMVGLPQIILCFAMLDIFSYNTYQIHIMPLWVFALIVMVLGSVILGIFFARAVWQAWGVAR